MSSQDPSGIVYLEEQQGVAADNAIAGWSYSFAYGYWGHDAARGVNGDVVFGNGAGDDGELTRTFVIAEAAVPLGETLEALQMTVRSSGDVRVDLPDSGFETLVANGADGSFVFSFRRIGSAGEFFPYDGSPSRRVTFSGLDALAQQSATVSVNIVAPPVMPGPVSYLEAFVPFVDRAEAIVLGDGTMPSVDAIGGVLGVFLGELFASAQAPLTVEAAVSYASTVGDGGLPVRVPVALVAPTAVLPPAVDEAGVMSVPAFAAALGETLAAWYGTAAPSAGGAFEFDVSVSGSAVSVPLLRLALVTVPLRGA